MNRAEEDYIKTIYELSINNDSKIIKNIDIAESLGFTDQSVNEMVKKLSVKGFLEFIPYKGVKLTEKGVKQAVRLIRAHRVWEVFLMDYLNYSWQEVHEQAEFLEHAGNDELIERLYLFLDKPKYCGHGNPIPSHDGTLSTVFKKSLFEFNVNDKFTLKRVLDVKELLSFLDEQNLKIDDSFIIQEKNEFSGYTKLVKDSQEYIITNKIAKMLFGI
ncbi:metal-dependent transcriptional regulator [Haploplasma axanthum]|uniref:Manganese transport regulator n=1 Tax=Haploplasma axanthum TaxID=29552 RepID=A0A449BBE3_HAPAX|nr:metal-dependent transcriptional regulator [Haploplasma axanthum]VEU79711.1 Iron-dependent repressor IdeR [Haploplasma axanthum]